MKWHKKYYENENFTQYSGKHNNHYLLIDNNDNTNIFKLCVSNKVGKSIFQDFDSLDEAKKHGLKLAKKGII